MKKINILSASAAILLVAGLFVTGCKKDDTTAPVITVTGGTSASVVLGTAYTDAGATASDDKDGTVTVTSDASSTNPDVTTAGVYTIHYSASDAAGNSTSATRSVTVIINRSSYVWSGYAALDTAASTGFFTYTGNIAAGSASDQIIISNFSGTTQNCVASVSGTTLTIASQSVGSFTMSGSGTMNNKGKVITILYNDGTENHLAVFTKQ